MSSLEKLKLKVCALCHQNSELELSHIIPMMGIFLFTLYHKGNDEVWENTQIVNGVGNIEAKDQRITSVCGQEITRIMENAERSQEQLSDRQQEKIKQRLQKAADKIEKYPIWDDFKKDREL